VAVARPASWVAWLTPLILVDTSFVATDCSSTAPAIEVLISLTCETMRPISRIASAVVWLALWIPLICCSMSPVALAVWLASDLTSDATTAKPLPASPARAASIVALSASRLAGDAGDDSRHLADRLRRGQQVADHLL